MAMITVAEITSPYAKIFSEIATLCSTFANTKRLSPCPMAKSEVMSSVLFLFFPMEKSAIAVRWSGPKACSIPYQKMTSSDNSIICFLFTKLNDYSVY